MAIGPTRLDRRSTLKSYNATCCGRLIERVGLILSKPLMSMIDCGFPIPSTRIPRGGEAEIEGYLQSLRVQGFCVVDANSVIYTDDRWRRNYLQKGMFSIK
jgi:hypothetical protein